MSLIYQALKKIQTGREFDVAPPYSRQNAEDAYSRGSFSVARIKAPLLFLFIAFTVGLLWWAVDRSRQAVQVSETAKGLHPAAQVNSSIEENILMPPAERQGGGEQTLAMVNAAKEKNLKGVELFRQKRFSLAVKEFLFSIRLFPEYAEAYNNAGLAYKQLGDVKKAEDSYKDALKYKSAYPEAMNNYGVLLDDRGERVRAREYFTKAISIMPDYADPYLNMAISFEKDKKNEEAIAYYEKFLSSLELRSSDMHGNGNRIKGVVRDVKERIFYLYADKLM